MFSLNILQLKFLFSNDINFIIMSKFTTNLRSLFSTKKKIFFLFGAPGVGKGTLAHMLEKDLGLHYLSVNQELRKVIKGTYTNGLEPSLIQKLRKVILAGGLIRDDLVVELVRQKSILPVAEKGLIISAFPRNQSQFKAFRQIFQVDGAINLTLREDILLKKIQNRRYCVSCGISYHVQNIKQEDYDLEFKIPTQANKCSTCHKQLSKREDDSLRTAKARIKEYNSRIKPILTALQQAGILLNFQVKRGIKDYGQLHQSIVNKFFNSK